MKRHHYFRIFEVLAAVLFGLGILNSCDDDNNWDPAPPTDWNTFYDNRLTGCWELVQADGIPVTGMQVNYLDFFGNGKGRYYYYDDGMQDSQRMAYYCQDAYSGASRYQMNLQYQYGSPTTVNYWFTNARTYLWMQWPTKGGNLVTYTYQAVPQPGW